MPCFLAPSEVAGLFVLVAKEDPARERRHQKAWASSRASTDVFAPRRGGARVRLAAVSVGPRTYVTDIVTRVPLSPSCGLSTYTFLRPETLMVMSVAQRLSEK